jgi:carbon monoxide dehydrogenase subunit G
MNLDGSQLIYASRQLVWCTLNDENVLRESIPGCRTLVRESDTEFKGTVSVKLGVVSATFAGAVTLSNISAPSSYTITGEGKGGIAGFAKGVCKVQLSEADAQSTWLHYTVKTDVGGKLASLGSRLLDGIARKMVAQFFDAFVSKVQESARTNVLSQEGR